MHLRALDDIPGSVGAAISDWLRGSRLLDLVAWAAIAVMGLLALTQVVGWSGNRAVAAVQSVTPYILGAAFPLAAGSFVLRRWAIGGAASVIAACFAVLAWALFFPPGQPAMRDGAAPLRVFESNLLYSSTRMDDVVTTIEGLGVDVLVFTEYTASHARVLLASPLSDTYPYRVERATGQRAGGTAIWSRYPLEDLGIRDTHHGTALAMVQSPDPIAVFAVHPPSPIANFGAWHRELGGLGDLTGNPNVGGSVVIDPDSPRLLIGDFNASYWHPAFRALLDEGWRDASQATHHAFSASWPNDWTFVPAFVRIDHALLNDHLVALDTANIDVPGSDHIGLLVTVAVAAD